jgi:hypothetical protein
VNSSEDEHIFAPGTVVNMTCTGTVGNPPGTLHWCYKRYGLDVDFIEYPSESAGHIYNCPRSENVFIF